MKFILNEKYLLEENKYILTEETAEETLKNALDKVAQKVSDILTVINNDKTDYVTNKKLLDKLDTLADEVDLAEEPATVKAKAFEYASQLSDTLGPRIRLYPEVNSELEAIKGFLNAKSDKKAAIKLKIKQFNKLLKDNALIKVDDMEIKNAKAALELVLQNLDKLNFKINLLVSSTKEALQAKQALQVLYKDLPAKSKVSSKIYSEIIETCNQFNQSASVQAIIKAINAETAERTTQIDMEKAEKQAQISRENKQKAISDSQVKDWAALYENCATKEDYDAFWKDYYKTEWKDKAELIKSYGLAFMEEVEQYGFDSINNPFISYLKAIDFDIPTDYYATLHNAVVDRLVKLPDLLGKGTFETNNLIFNKNLFTLSRAQFRDYLEVQNQLINNITSAKGHKNISSEVSGIVAFYEEKATNPGQILNNLVLEAGNINNLIDTKPIADKTLRALSRIKQELALLFKDTEEIKKTTDNEVTNVVEKLSVVTAKKLLTYLCEYFAVSFNNIVVALVNKYPSIATAIDTTEVTFSEKLSFMKSLKLAYIEYTREQVELWIIELAKQAKLIQATKD